MLIQSHGPFSTPTRKCMMLPLFVLYKKPVAQGVIKNSKSTLEEIRPTTTTLVSSFA